MMHVLPPIEPNYHLSWHGKPLSTLSRDELIEALVEAGEMLESLIDDRARTDKQYIKLLYRV